MVQISEEVLVYDIETRTNGLPDPNKDTLRLFGCYSYKTKKYYLLTNIDDIQKVVNAHKFLVGFNTESYDEPIAKRAGVSYNYKIKLDLYDIIKKRAAIIKIEQGMLKDLLLSYSLKFITETLGLADKETGKLEIDYKLFNKDTWTPEEFSIVKEYTMRDLEITKKLYEWLEEQFLSFKDFVTEDDIKKKRYLTDSPAVFSYKVMCKELKLEPEFTDAETEHGEYEGGYVAYPAGERFENNIVLLDFASLYPNLFIQCNLFSHKCDCCEIHEKWNGSGFFKVNGYYCTKKQGRVEEMYKKIFLLRKQYKKEKNQKEYALKIILNAGYGLTGNPKFKHLYHRTSASDCTAIGRQCILYVRKRFREEGYINIFTDTDSIAVQCPEGKTITDVIELSKKIVSEIQQYMPFPWIGQFELKVEAEIKYAFFFKGNTNEKDDSEILDDDDFVNKHKGLLKKNYILVTKDNELIIKNLGIRKKSNSPLSRKIFWEYLAPKIKEGEVKFSKTYLKNLINELLEKDLTLAAMRKDVGPISMYEKSKTGLQAQITTKYGSGIHFLIPNTKNIGVGKGKSYCTIEEFKKHNLKLTDIDLDNVWNELEYFTKKAVEVNIFSFG